VAPLKLLDFGSACDIKSGAGLNQVSRVLTYADVGSACDIKTGGQRRLRSVC
jgi:hypothetical protein